MWPLSPFTECSVLPSVLRHKAGRTGNEADAVHQALTETPPLAMDDPAEAGRIDALNRLDVIDTPRDEAFDRITMLIRNIFDLPVAIVSMTDGHRQ